MKLIPNEPKERTFQVELTEREVKIIARFAGELSPDNFKQLISSPDPDNLALGMSDHPTAERLYFDAIRILTGS